MQVTETNADGLKRAYSLVVTAADLDTKTNEKLTTVRKDFAMKGFRKGKAPMPLLKKMFGKSVFGEVVQETVESSVAKHIAEQGHRPASQPDVKIANENFTEGDDLNIEISYECLPDVPEVDFAAIEVERKVVAVDDQAVEEALSRLADGAIEYEDREDGAAAQDKDQVVIDFEGSVDGEAFEGGKAEDYPLVLGSKSFIPGFEEQLIGVKVGDTPSVNVSFPEEYGAKHLAGKAAVFAVNVKSVRAPKAAEIDDALASRYGAENLEDLRTKLRERIGHEYNDAARALLKRRLLDQLNTMVSFELPETLVDNEAKAIAHHLWHEEHPDEKGHDHPEIEPTQDHVELAQRRVRLGLLLADIGQKNDVQIDDQALGQAIMTQARQYPGQEREFFEYVRKNREALEQIRAPLYEDKVIDLILEKAQVKDTEVSKEALQAEMDALDADD